MERRSGALLLAALLPLGLMCSAFSEQLLGDACDRYKEPCWGRWRFRELPSRTGSRQKIRLGLAWEIWGQVTRPTRGGVTTKAPSIIGCELHKSSGSLLDRVGGSGLLPEKRSETG